MECSYEGGTVPTIECTVKSTELVMKQPFQIIKAANNGETDADLLKGAGFSAYLKSSLKKKEDGSYDFSHAEPVILTADGKTEMFTDEKGYACSIPLPYGTYIVRETTTPHNYKPVEDFEITIRENNPDKPQVWKVLLDKEFSAKLKIIKKDDETKKPVLVAGTEFKIYDLDHKKYVEQVTTYPTVTVHKSFFTDSQGYLILPKNLEIGHYRIEEVTAPEGYVVNKNYVEITVDSDTAYEVDGVSGDVIIEVSYEDQPVKGNLVVYKKGEMLSGFENDFIYKEQYLSGAEFEVRAAEDICTPDHQKDTDGNRLVLYAKDTLVTTITTGESGKAVAKDLPLGRYYVVETKAPEGFVLNPEPVKVALTYQDQDTPIVEAEAIVGNDRQKVSISVEKQDAENGQVLSGAVFGIYNKKDIQANGKVLVKADTLLQESEIAGQVGQTPQGWNGSIFSMIEGLSNSVIMPIAGIIITFVLCYELISMLTERNNMHDIDTWMFFKYFVKMWIAVYLVSNTFTITMAVFDVGQNVVNSAAGLVSGDTSIDISSAITDLSATLESMEIGELVILALETLIVSFCMKIMSVLITVILYVRMIEIYLYTSVAPIPFATMSNREWGQIGTNYFRGLFALAFQAFLMMVCVAIYAVLVAGIQFSDNLSSSLFGVMAYTVILCFSLFKTGSLSKSIFNAH